ncbi:T9SS type A sorting domain-containing protein [bacterium]|nr:T9SS type A sorting domain-containing protein [bacterium]
MKQTALLFAFILSSLILKAGDPNIFYYVADSDNNFYSVNRVSGVVTLIGATGVSSIEAIAYYPAPGGNQLFATNGGDFGTINIATGAYTFMAEVDGGGFANGAAGPQTLDDVDGLMLDGRTFKLWASERKSGATSDLIFQINPTTGQFVKNAFGPGVDYIVIEGNGADVDVDDIAVSPVTGRMYASSNFNGNNDELLSINKFTGTFGVASTLSEDDIEGLAFSNDGQLWGSEGDDDRLSKINISTGVMSDFIPLTGGDVEALASLVADANSASGTVYNDTDYDGVKDIGELGVPNIRVYLYIDNNSNGQVDPEDTRVQSTLTDVNGDYQFLYAATGNLLTSTAYFSFPFGFALTTDNVETISYTDAVNFGEVDNNNNFGIASGPDCDGDGIPNFYETGRDSDLDGVRDSCDLDSDNDGIRDNVEGIGDFDNDGIADYRDRDSDDDGIPDAIEVNSGVIPSGYSSAEGNVSGTDSDGNGIVDSRESFAGSGVMVATDPDSDNDGLKDVLDLDSDNDGILDIIEAGGVDVDGDGQVDALLDADNNGYYDNLESSPLPIFNSDNGFETANGLPLRPNYIDIDSDADGIDDTMEGYSTLDYKFPSLVIDSDQDGIVDFWDVSTFEAPITPYDRDGDGTPDYMDSDSDNDGVSDFIEGNDANSNGVADAFSTGTDINGNGLDDAFDSDCAQSIEIAAADFAEENNSDGSINLSSSDLEFCNDGGTNQTVGLYFSGVPVDQGETINSAFIQFETDEVETGSITITIRGQLSTNATAFAASTNNVTSRTPTLNNESWSPADWNTIGEASTAQRTVDISSIVQEIVNQGGWVNGNNLVILLTGPNGNRRTAEVDPVLIINTDAIVCASNVAHQDFDGDGEDDFRDNDDDSDGIPTLSEIPDSEPNGTPDYLEDNTGGCGLGLTPSSSPVAGNADIVVSNSGVDNSSNALGVTDSDGAEIFQNGDIFVLDLSDILPAGSNYTINWAERTGESGTASMILEESIDGVNWIPHPAPPTTNSTTFVNAVVTANTTTRYLRISKDNPPSTTDFLINSVTYNVNTCITDTDSDGIADDIDIDDDNDGILDVTEELSCSGFLNYEFYDGVPSGFTVDNIPTSGALATGVTSNFDVDALQAASDPGDSETFGIRFTGFINISTSETYTFYTSSDDGSKLFIGATEVVNNDGNHAYIEQSGTIALTPGSYAITVLFFENTGDENLSVAYSSASISKRDIPFVVLSVSSSGCDTDNDGIINALDLDSDNDGIADIIEAGGEDLDNNGKVDTFSDTDGDGWANTFDSDNGGTALVDLDSDIDGINDRVDIDSDNDGIVDVIEAQISSASPNLPIGSDLDMDGIDDAFDSDLGNSLLTPINTDGVDTPDYIDTDSDNDGYNDLLEAYDTDNDGVSDTQASGLDTDLDGLDDNFDNINGKNSSTNVTNGGQTSSSFPNLDQTNTPERDWREFLDTDNDGISDFIDIDDDNDGILDVDESASCIGSGTGSLNYEFYDVVPSGFKFANIPTTGALSTGTISTFNVNTLQAAVDPGDADVFSIRYTGFISISTSETYTFYTTSDDGSGLYINGNLIVNNDDLHGNRERSGTITLTPGIYPITVVFFENSGGANLTVSYQTATISKRAVPFSVLSEVNFCDTDNDGIQNYLDLDSDNDGIPDIIEAGGVDANNDGRVDDNTDTDNDGWANTFDSDNGGSALDDADQDGDGIKNRVDLDADNDGIADIVEAGGVDSNNDGRADGFDDIDQDGFADSFDIDEGGTALPIDNFDGDALANFLDLDSDNDGITDNVESQTTTAFLAPLDSDTDNDGWDNRYDSDNGGTAINLSNHENNGNPDYIDTDTDGDGQPDWIEGFDDDEAGMATDGDALNDFLARASAFVGAGGNAAYYNNALDGDTDGIPDWLEDTDLDGQPNFIDFDSPFYHDSDNDGLVDLFDPDSFGVPSSLPNKDNDLEPDWRDTDNATTLPVSLLNFIAEKKLESVLLKWTTLSESNNDYFTVEKSIDSRMFQEVGTVNGAGNSLERRQYELIDFNPFKGISYYRLKQTDFNGEYTYSELRAVEFGGSTDQAKVLMVYPNPTKGGMIYLEIDVERSGTIDWKLFNEGGQLIIEDSETITEHNAILKTELLKGKKLSKGMYTLKIVTPNEVISKKVICY